MRTTTACLRPALIIYGSIAIVLFAFVAFFANPDLPLPYRQEVMPADYSGPSLLEGWVRYDAGWYRSIAEHGYFFRGDQQQSSVAFFPVYALVMRAFHSVFGGDTAAWGIFITFVAGLTVSVLFYRWCVPRLGERGAQYALAVLLLWPYSWYLFGAVYADALFIALVIGAFSLLERDRVVLSTMVGAIATATRPVGVAVVIGLFVRELERRGVFSLPRFDRVRVGRLGPSPPVAVEPWMKLPWLRFDRAAFRQRCLLPLFSVVGLASYMVYLAWKFGEPFAFAIAERAPGWDLKPGPHTWFKVEFFDRVRHFPYKDGWYTWDGWYTLGIVFQVVLAIGVLLLTRRVGRKLGWGYAVYVVVVLAIPLVGSKDFQGIGRYALAAFPAFAVSGQWLATHPRLAIGPLAVSAAALGLLCSGYARGAYVA